MGDSGGKSVELGNGTVATGESGNEPAYLVKKKTTFAIMLAYSGIGYHGLQINGDFPTIERDLVAAICDTGVIHERSIGFMNKMGWTRAARTDKGVHAVGQVVSAKMRLSENLDHIKQFVDVVNEKLPKQIRVLDCVRTTKGFNSKNKCTARKYEYLLPTFVFRSRPFEDFEQVKESLFGSIVETDEKLENSPSDGEKNRAAYTYFREELCKGFKLSTEMFDNFTACMEKYVGSHKFHNFTTNVAFDDPSALRYIVSVTVDKPFTVEGIEVIRINIFGQSFMLHQIRKMIGTALETARRGLKPSVIEDHFVSKQQPTPMVPGEGLALRACVYTHYNERYGDVDPEESKKRFGTQYAYRCIDFEREDIIERANNFRVNNLYPIMMQQELEKNVFSKYIWFQDQNPFPFQDNVAAKTYKDYLQKAEEKKRKTSAKRRMQSNSEWEQKQDTTESAQDSEKRLKNNFSNGEDANASSKFNDVASSDSMTKNLRAMQQNLASFLAAAKRE